MCIAYSMIAWISKDIQWSKSLKGHAFISMHSNLCVCYRVFLGAGNELHILKKAARPRQDWP